MRPFLERLPWTEGSSFAQLNRALEDGIPFQWHHHPAWELTLTLNSIGQRFIGDHVGDYGDGDLVLVGPNLPHTWVSRDRIAAGPHRAYVIWFQPEWAARISEQFVEFDAVGRLFARAGRGLSFSAGAAANVRDGVERFFTAAPDGRLMAFLQVMAVLAEDANPQPLASAPALQTPRAASRDRIDRVLTHIHQNYERPLGMPELADVAALSVSGLHRLFLRQIGTTVSDYVIGLRVGAAAARLAGSKEPISHIATDVGYGALANFNRQFRQAKGMTPSAYRAQYQGAHRK